MGWRLVAFWSDEAAPHFSNDKSLILLRSRSSIRYFKMKSKKTMDLRKPLTITCIAKYTIIQGVTALMKSQKNIASHHEAVLRQSPKEKHFFKAHVNTWCDFANAPLTVTLWRLTHDGQDFAVKRTVHLVQRLEDRAVAKENVRRAAKRSPQIRKEI